MGTSSAQQAFGDCCALQLTIDQPSGESWRDTKRSAVDASDVAKKVSTLSPSRTLKVSLAPAGGYVAIIEAVK